MSADRRIAAFLTLAGEELYAARILAQGAPRQAAYYVQQAAAKTLEVWNLMLAMSTGLLLKSGRFPD